MKNKTDAGEEKLLRLGCKQFTFTLFMIFFKTVRRRLQSPPNSKQRLTVYIWTIFYTLVTNSSQCAKNNQNPSNANKSTNQDNLTN